MAAFTFDSSVCGEFLSFDDKEFICKDKDGNIFISLEDIDEDVLSVNHMLTHCLAVVKVGTDYLFGWNKYRGRYEIFGGCIEQGESAKDCIVRECREELGIQNEEIKYLGAMRFLMKPDYFSANERIELGGLYGIFLPDTDIDTLRQNIKDTEEITKLALYSRIRGIEPIAEIDEKLLEYYI